jgi:hypothetical protein
MLGLQPHCFDDPEDDSDIAISVDDEVKHVSFNVQKKVAEFLPFLAGQLGVYTHAMVLYKSCSVMRFDMVLGDGGLIEIRLEKIFKSSPRSCIQLPCSKRPSIVCGLTRPRGFTRPLVIWCTIAS